MLTRAAMSCVAVALSAVLVGSMGVLFQEMHATTVVVSVNFLLVAALLSALVVLQVVLAAQEEVPAVLPLGEGALVVKPPLLLEDSVAVAF